MGTTTLPSPVVTKGELAEELFLVSSSVLVCCCCRFCGSSWGFRLISLMLQSRYCIDLLASYWLFFKEPASCNVWIHSMLSISVLTWSNVSRSHDKNLWCVWLELLCCDDLSKKGKKRKGKEIWGNIFRFIPSCYSPLYFPIILHVQNKTNQLLQHYKDKHECCQH